MWLSEGKLMLGLSYAMMHRSLRIGNEDYTSSLGHQGVLPSGNRRQKKKKQTTKKKQSEIYDWRFEMWKAYASFLLSCDLGMVYGIVYTHCPLD